MFLFSAQQNHQIQIDFSNNIQSQKKDNTNLYPISILT